MGLHVCAHSDRSCQNIVFSRNAKLNQNNIRILLTDIEEYFIVTDITGTLFLQNHIINQTIFNNRYDGFELFLYSEVITALLALL